MRKVNRTSIYCLSAAALALVVGGTTTAISAHKTINLEVDGQQKVITGFQIGTVEDLLNKEGIRVEKEDKVQPAVSEELQEGTTIVVKHAKVVTVQDGTGQPVTVKTQANTVGDVLKELNITVNEADKVNHELIAALTNDQQISIIRRTEDVKITEEAIPFQTERQPDANVVKGEEKVLTPGVEGKVTITTRTYFENGKEVDRKEERQVAANPVNQVVAYGTKEKPVEAPKPVVERPLVIASRSGQELNANKTLTMAASAYSMPGSRTATGTAAGPGTVAVDPNVIPLGTKLYIEGYGYAVALDTGGAIKGNKIDLHFNTEAECVQFGRRAVVVHILN